MAFSSVMPDRLLIVHRLDGTGRRYAVSIFGVAPEGNFVRQTDPSRPRSNAMELRVEERFAGTNGEFCWSPTAVDWPTQKGEVLEIYPESSMSPGVFPIQDVVDEQSDLAGVSVWRTGFILPNRKNGSHYRITAREREDWLTEDSDGEPVPWSETKTIIKGRYVYIDELTL
jgi:hypothetical protein